MFPRASLCLLAAAFLAGCSTPPSPLPKGEQSFQGTVKAAPISLTRRGTHLLAIEGVERYFLESSVHDLRTFEDLDVRVRGMLEPNLSSEDLPVLFVVDIAMIDAGSGSALDVFGLEFRIPASWKVQKEGQNFLISQGTSSGTFLSMTLTRLPQKHDSPSMNVAGISAYRRVDEQTGVQEVFVPRGSGTLLITFQPPAEQGMASETLRQDFLRFLNSATLRRTHSSMSLSSLAATGSGTGLACGGIAGVLCPERFYCIIIDPTDNTGVCKPSPVRSSARR
jgi:hypothetical protein